VIIAAQISWSSFPESSVFATTYPFELRFREIGLFARSGSGSGSAIRVELEFALVHEFR
jgi:hypothetical protein